MLELKPDFDKVLDRYEAWWDCAVLDRPLTTISTRQQEAEAALRDITKWTKKQ